VSADRNSNLLVHIVTVPQTLNFLRGQIAYMKRRGFQVAAIASPGDSGAIISDAEGIPVYAIQMSRRMTPARDLVALWKLYRLLVNLKPGIVHAHTPKAGLLGTLAAFLARVPVRIYHIRGLPFESARGVRCGLLRWTERVSCRLANRVLAVSHSMRNIAIRENLCSPRKIEVPAKGSGNGVDANGKFNPSRYGAIVRKEMRRELRLPSEAVVIGFVGRVVRDKGIVELAQAWHSIRQENPLAFLLLVGPLEPQDPVPASTLRMLEGDANVRMTGGVSEVAPFYTAMDILALPTYREGFPNVPLEAAAMCLPVVATQIPGCVDAVVNGVTGTLVDPRNPVELYQALKQYIEKPELRQLHGSNGRQRVIRDFQQEGIWKAVYAEYRRLLNMSEDVYENPEVEELVAHGS